MRGLVFLLAAVIAMFCLVTESQAQVFGRNRVQVNVGGGFNNNAFRSNGFHNGVRFNSFNNGFRVNTFAVPVFHSSGFRGFTVNPFAAHGCF